MYSFIDIKIQGRGKSEKAILFSQEDEQNPFPAANINIKFRRDKNVTTICYEDFRKYLLLNCFMADYIGYKMQGDCKISVHRIDRYAAKMKYFIGEIVQFDFGFFIVAEFPHHGRRTSVTLTFKVLSLPTFS